MDWLIVGLGNPGARYEGTRHNIGRDAVIALAQRHGATVDRVKHNARYTRINLSGHRVLLAVPTTYMNDSGRAVAPLARFYQIEPKNILVVYDEVDLPLGRLRLRGEGGAGGHNGMRSIIRSLGTQEFPRLRMGVGRPPEGWDTADHVLSQFSRAEQDDARILVIRAAETIERAVADGISAAMNAANAG